MKRPLKFRAWDSDNSKMVDVYAIDWVGGDKRRPISINYPQGKLYDAPEDFGGAIKLMQYTGLLDKNGVEIFEGDILKHGGYIGEVTWYEDTACFMQSMINSTGSHLIDSTCEVIGNRFEHPELLS